MIARRRAAPPFIALLALLLGACASATIPAHARDVQPERPTVATHAGTVTPGYLEMETGVERDRLNAHASALQIPTEFKIGVSPRVQLSVMLPASKAPDVPFGFGDVTIGAKWRVAEEAPFWEDIALLPSVTFATGGVRGVGSTAESLLLIDSHKFGGVSLDVNAGATWRGGDGIRAPRESTMWTVSGGLPVHGNLGWAVETFGYPGTGGASGSRPTVALLTGPTYLVRPELALDVGLITPLHGPQAHAIYAGLVTNLGRLLPHHP